MPLDLELTYTRHDGKTVQVVSKDVGTFRELHPSSLLVDGTDDQPQDADRAPNVSETDPIESSAHQTTVAVETGPSHGVLREPVTVEEVSPGDAQRWLQDGDESTRNFLTHRDVSFLHVPDVERMQRHLIHVVDHADDANPAQPPTPSRASKSRHRSALTDMSHATHPTRNPAGESCSVHQN
ncbi:hypothetical protein ACFQ60_47455 [Streptomyces zhihengii]